MPGTKLNPISVDYFLSTGLDYKGQLQCCHEDIGVISKFEVEVDPARLASGVFSASIKGNARAAVLKKAVIIAQVGPSSIGNQSSSFKIDTPVMVNCLEGYKFEGELGAELFAGVKVDRLIN